MKHIINYIFILCVFFYGCNNREQKINDAEVEKIISIETKGVLVSKDSISEPSINIASAPDLISVTESTALPYANNVHPLVQPNVITLSKNLFETNYVSLIGEPSITSAVEKIVSCILPEPVNVLPLRFKDDATCNIQYLDVVQGFGGSYIKTILQDNNENIWTYGNGGLLRYDGKSYVSFTEKNEILRGIQQYLRKDKEGSIWMLTKTGICKYNGKYFTVYDTLGGLPSANIYAFAFDKDGLMWLCSPKGLTSFDGEKFTTYTSQNGFTLNPAISIKCDDSKNVWCGSVESGACCFNGKRFVYLNKDNGLVSNQALAIVQDNKGNVWLSGERGATKFNGKTFEHFTDKQGLINNVIRKMITDSEGNVWFSHYRGGMSCFDGKQFTWFTEKEGLTVNTVTALQEDRNGNIWAGTDGGGLCRYSKGSFNHFTDKEILNRIVISINEDDKNNIWLGTYDEGLCKYDGKNFMVMKDQPKILNTVVFIYKNSKGHLYFLMDGNGIVKYDGDNYYYYSHKSGLFSSIIIRAFEDKDGNMWFGSNNDGVFKFDGKQFVRYKKDQGLCGNCINGIAQDKEGNMWIGTSNGLTKISGNKLFSFTTNEGLASNHIRNLMTDRNGNLWIGTSKGINKYDGKHMLKITKNEGLSDNYIRSIVEDKKESTKAGYTGIWASTDYGINHIVIKDSDNLGEDLKVYTYTRPDGLRGEDFCSNSGFMDSKGRAWWGAVKGLTTLQTNKIYIDRDIPDVHLDYINLEQNYIDFNSLRDSIASQKNWFIGEKKELNLNTIHFTGVPAFKNYPENLKLPYNINNITFNYSAINWLNSHKIRYQYFLEGSDDEWRPITADNKAIYTNLDYGTYTFKVRARGLLDVWSKHFEYTFIILPPWWKTPFAYILYSIFSISAIFLYLKWRTRSLIKRQKELENIIIDRTADVIEEKNKVEEKSKIIEEKQKETFDSLQYAKQIQKLLLANHKLVNETLPDSFVVFKPKDIVSGDFYWAAKKEDRFYLAVCDSTGHGVPGAFMSLLNINFLNEAINEKNIADPNEVFNYVRNRLIDNISQDGRQDGMDGILICVKDGSKKMTYAAANNAPVLIKNNELSILDTDKMPIGKGEKNEPFNLYTFEMTKGDQLYLFTDGFADQFGGPKGKKYKYKPMYELMLKNNHLPVIKQEELLFEEFENWKGSLEQVDDVCILGIRI